MIATVRVAQHTTLTFGFRQNDTIKQLRISSLLLITIPVVF